jgi:hypothetical protein
VFDGIESVILPVKSFRAFVKSIRSTGEFIMTCTGSAALLQFENQVGTTKGDLFAAYIDRKLQDHDNVRKMDTEQLLTWYSHDRELEFASYILNNRKKAASIIENRKRSHSTNRLRAMDLEQLFAKVPPNCDPDIRAFLELLKAKLTVVHEAIVANPLVQQLGEANKKMGIILNTPNGRGKTTQVCNPCREVFNVIDLDFSSKFDPMPVNSPFHMAILDVDGVGEQKNDSRKNTASYIAAVADGNQRLMLRCKYQQPQFINPCVVLIMTNAHPDELWPNVFTPDNYDTLLGRNGRFHYFESNTPDFIPRFCNAIAAEPLNWEVDAEN